MKFAAYQVLLCGFLQVAVITFVAGDFLEQAEEGAALSLEQTQQLFDDNDETFAAKRSEQSEMLFPDRNRNTRNNMDPLKGLGLGKRSQYRLNPLNGLGFGKRNSKMNPLTGFGFGKRGRLESLPESVEFGKRKIDPLRGGFGK